VTLDDGDDSDIIAAWNRGEIEILACHPASAGHGLNLQQGGHTAVWYGLNWSLELYLQFNARLDRQGQKMPVMIHRILARDTIDLLVLDRLANRTSTQEAVKHFIKLKQQEKHNERIA
jgi:SNF2 family DNA or RNA helicase